MLGKSLCESLAWTPYSVTSPTLTTVVMSRCFWFTFFSSQWSKDTNASASLLLYDDVAVWMANAFKGPSVRTSSIQGFDGTGNSTVSHDVQLSRLERSHMSSGTIDQSKRYVDIPWHVHHPVRSW